MHRQLSFTHIREQIDHVLQKRADISQIYISIGGKYNEPDAVFVGTVIAGQQSG